RRRLELAIHPSDEELHDRQPPPALPFGRRWANESASVAARPIPRLHRLSTASGRSRLARMRLLVRRPLYKAPLQHAARVRLARAIAARCASPCCIGRISEPSSAALALCTPCYFSV